MNALLDAFGFGLREGFQPLDGGDEVVDLGGKGLGAWLRVFLWLGRGAFLHLRGFGGRGVLRVVRVVHVGGANGPIFTVWVSSFVVFDRAEGLCLDGLSSGMLAAMAKIYIPFVGLVPVLAALLLGCGDGNEGNNGTACTEEARSSVMAKVVDGAGAAVTDAMVTYTVDGGASKTCDSVAMDGNYVCGYEEAGAFVVTATKGAMTATQNVTIVKTADGCHVEGQSITLTLM